MKIFWENLTRYPRFLITSVSGLIIVLLNPLIKLAKKNTITQLFLVVFVFLTFITFSCILNAMLNL
jgi:hypothetical protein|uniref:Uncharacterized protein ycf33 n=1 Tax=Pseudopedinella elastica TaxID=35684 RepID=A0A516ZA82_9STRA|nr:Ycf33 [Pseudopedinella elastica]QDR24625.1 Ycf33 [Pseudopedinella elastica]